MEVDSAVNEARRIALHLNGAASRLLRQDSRCDIMSEPWDSLIILDACRYDMFKNHNTIDGVLESRISVGSESWEFLRSHFQGNEYHDTIYITANPHAPKLDSGTFFLTENLLKSEWDADLKTVLPEVITERAVEIHEEYPNKRLIVHYMQPHFPFIGETGKEISHAGVTQGDGSTDEKPHVWSGLQYGKLDVELELVQKAYEENLNLTLPHVDDLIEELDGLAVVTSDHGNIVGERTWPVPIRTYGHPRGLHFEPLLKVPWLKVSSGTRRTIEKGEPITSSAMADETINQRLSDLGYK